METDPRSWPDKHARCGRHAGSGQRVQTAAEHKDSHAVSGRRRCCQRRDVHQEGRHAHCQLQGQLLQESQAFSRLLNESQHCTINAPSDVSLLTRCQESVAGVIIVQGTCSLLQVLCSLKRGAAQDSELELKYKSCYARILDAKRRFLEAATRYYDLSQISTSDSDAGIKVGPLLICLPFITSRP